MNHIKRSRMFVIYTLIALLLIVGIFTITWLNNAEDASSKTISESPSIAGQPQDGNEQTKVSIVEFGDYKCPSCKIWGEQVWPQLKQDYIDTGKATFAYINTMFHGEESNLAAQASEVVYMNYPELFWEFHKAMFDEQPSQANHDDLWVTETNVLEIAAAVIPDLDVEKFKTALYSQKILDELDLDQQQVDQFNIQQTPTIVVNNIVMDNPFDYAAIQRAIEHELNIER
ncbi:DsbA family protein [Paenibacillus agaridevorans]|uniref:DsbA family protein n=1 Tax=Paenibacillus agaridevorans TaxID=171404 RepID=UPI001BE4144B|nr:thioredoxin domain-containing protein [Paenibacillus agaridevorans]